MPVVNMEPGVNVSITKIAPLLDNITIGFSWNTITPNGHGIDLTPSAIMCDQKGKAIDPSSFFFFNQLPDDNSLTIENEDDEQIDITLSKIPSHVDKIMFIVYADPDSVKPQFFSAVNSAEVTLMDKNLNALARFELPMSQVKESNAVVFAELYRRNGEWRFRAIGQGYSTGIIGVMKTYGIEY